MTSVESSVGAMMADAIGRNVDTLVLAVSGGIDSVVLAHACANAHPRPDLIVAHIDHQLRTSSKADAACVRRLAASLGLCVEISALDVSSGASVQHHARYQRYARLGAIADYYAATAILTAHHEDDQVEGFILSERRGARWRAMHKFSYFDTAMKEVWRPLLDVGRAQIAHYAGRHQLEWVDDPTNTDRRYLRNAIRQQLAEEPKLREAVLSHLNSPQAKSSGVEEVVRTPWTARTSRPPALSASIDAVLTAIEGAHLSKHERERLASTNIGENARSCGHRVVVNVGEESVVAERSWGQGTRLLDSRMPAPIVIDLAEEPTGALPWFERTITWRGRSGTLEVRGPLPGDKIQLGDRGRKRVADVLRENRIMECDRWRVPVISWRSRVVAVGEFRSVEPDGLGVQITVEPRKIVEEFSASRHV